MHDRRKGRDRRKRERRHGRSQQRAHALVAGVEVFGWTILAHPLFLEQIETLARAAESERADSSSPAGPNVKLLGHLLDLAFDTIPRDPGSAAFRHGGTLGQQHRNWFRGKTGGGRYRLFYRFQSAARIIVYAWVNDEKSLRTYGSRTDAYAVFARMLEAGNPPDDWDALVAAASKAAARQRLDAIAQRRSSRSSP